MRFLSGKKLLLLGVVIVLLAAIPLTVYFMQQQQELRSRAVKATTLSLCDSAKPASCASSLTVEAGKTFSLDVVANPGTNLVSLVKLKITYDPNNLATSSANTACGDAICPRVLTTLSGPSYSSGAISITLSSAADISKIIQKTTKIATITFEAKTPVVGAANKVEFGEGTKVLSYIVSGGQDTQGENVLSTTRPAEITIAAALTPIPTRTPTPTPSGPTPTSVANQQPICSALNVDREASGTAPFSITFTANGRDTDGTVSKVTFDFGDGPVQDVTQTGGIGTNSVSVQLAHTYNNAGTFTASATLTDNSGATSTPSSACTKTITVTAGIGAPLPTATPTATPSPTLAMVELPVESPTPTPVIVIEPPGPQDFIVRIGAVAAILSLVGALLFFAL